MPDPSAPVSAVAYGLATLAADGAILIPGIHAPRWPITRPLAAPAT